MKFLLVLVIIGVLLGTQTSSIRWRELAIIGTVVFGLVGWQTFNILFRYIGVE